MTDNAGTDDFEVLNQILQLLRSLSEERRASIVRALSNVVLDIDLQKKDRHRMWGSDSVVAWGTDSVVAKEADVSARVPFSQDLKLSPKAFLLEKQPRTDVERIACLAYYLTHYRDILHFKTIDLSKLNTEAAQPKLSNPTFATRNAVAYGYLAQATKGQRQLSAAGEQFVTALPDREAAKAIMSNFLKRRRGKSKGRKSRKKGDG
jgi:hypothetical protein